MRSTKIAVKVESDVEGSYVRLHGSKTSFLFGVIRKEEMEKWFKYKGYKIITFEKFLKKYGDKGDYKFLKTAGKETFINELLAGLR